MECWRVGSSAQLRSFRRFRVSGVSRPSGKILNCVRSGFLVNLPRPTIAFSSSSLLRFILIADTRNLKPLSFPHHLSLSSNYFPLLLSQRPLGIVEVGIGGIQQCKQLIHARRFAIRQIVLFSMILPQIKELQERVLVVG